ncbi:hypothetical protein [Stenotrophomonas indicatrix]|uniref:hypothetical protein n=1 Tax=Stenotrophomonas indicatrix TaxID=2045451 RepID=UPI000FD6F316|nr:hypothetical protein [Stenotrophomonas indicatrix]
MQELERAVSGGDSSAAQAARGFVRNLYGSGQGYNSLYGQVTGLIDGMKVGDLDKSGVGMGELADTSEAPRARCVRRGGLPFGIFLHLLQQTSAVQSSVFIACNSCVIVSAKAEDSLKRAATQANQRSLKSAEIQGICDSLKDDQTGTGRIMSPLL